MPLFVKCLPVTALLMALLFVSAMARSECAVDTEGAGAARVAVSGMPFLVPQQARIGGVNGADTRLPQLIVAELNTRGLHVALDYSHLDLRNLARPRGLFAGHSTGNDIPWDIVQWPETQFVVTGVIENVALASDKTFSFLGRYARRSLALMDRRYNQSRRIALVVEMFDTGSGALVMQKRYVSHANWGLPRTEAPGIDSPKFWQSAYGRELINVAERVIADVEDSLSCAVVNQAMLDASRRQAHL